LLIGSQPSYPPASPAFAHSHTASADNGDDKEMMNHRNKVHQIKARHCAPNASSSSMFPQVGKKWVH